MSSADYLRIQRLPDQIDLVERRMAQLQRTPAIARNCRWRDRWHAAQARHDRLTQRAASLGLRDLARRAGLYAQGRA